MTLRFWFIHDTNTCHYTVLKLGGRSETGREKRVTPEFGERKEEKILPPNLGRYSASMTGLTMLVVEILVIFRTGHLWADF
jgi:hypothetical protein